VVGGSIVTEPVVEEMIAELIAKKITLLIVDPFVRSHRLEENKNDHIDFAAALWAYVAEKANCTILLVHHFKKGGVSGEADSFRGASTLTNASCAAVSMATMSEKEAAAPGVEFKQRRFYIRADNAKQNLAPPPEDTTWFKLISVPLDNGDFVHTLERWKPLSPWADLPWELVTQILEAIQEGPEEGERFSPARQGDRWAGQVIVDVAGKTIGQAGKIIDSWTESGLLEVSDYASAKVKKQRKGVTVNMSKLVEMQRATKVEFSDE
jgi:hypothetical protein